MNELTLEQMKTEIRKMKNNIEKFEATIDTVLDLQGYEHDSYKGWRDGAEDVNKFIEVLIELFEEFDTVSITTSQSHFELMVLHYEKLIEFAKYDILKEICGIMNSEN